MSGRNILEKWFGEKKDNYVDIIIAGRVFGGRLGESRQRPRSFQWIGDVLLICFETTERLVIAGIRDVTIGDYNALVISAEDARFGWHYYGKPQSPENWCEEIYRKKGNIVVLVRLGALMPGTETFQFDGEDFVKLL